VPPPPRAEKLARSSFLAGLDATTKLALWVTLAFLEVAGADGVVAAREYVALKKNLVRLKLPDMRQQHGPEALQNMLRDGLLYELSSEYAVQSVEARTELANVLVEIMQADGAVDPRELEVVRRISNWLGLTLTGG